MKETRSIALNMAKVSTDPELISWALSQATGKDLEDFISQAKLTRTQILPYATHRQASVRIVALYRSSLFTPKKYKSLLDNEQSSTVLAHFVSSLTDSKLLEHSQKSSVFLKAVLRSPIDSMRLASSKEIFSTDMVNNLVYLSSTDAKNVEEFITHLDKTNLSAIFNEFVPSYAFTIDVLYAFARNTNSFALETWPEVYAQVNAGTGLRYYSGQLDDSAYYYLLSCLKNNVVLTKKDAKFIKSKTSLSNTASNALKMALLPAQDTLRVSFVKTQTTPTTIPSIAPVEDDLEDETNLVEMLFESKISFKDFLEKAVDDGTFQDKTGAVEEVIYSMSYNKFSLDLAVDLAHFLQNIKKVTDEDIETFEYLLNEIPDIYALDFIDKAIVSSASPVMQGILYGFAFKTTKDPEYGAKCRNFLSDRTETLLSVAHSWFYDPALASELPVWMLWNDWTACNVNNKSFKPFNDLVSYAVLKGPNHIDFLDQTAPGFTGTVYQLRETLENIFE